MLLPGTGLLARDDRPTVGYTPSLVLVEGDLPVSHSYELIITSPANVPVGSSVSISPVVVAKPRPASVDKAVAESYVTLDPSTLIFTGPNQPQTTTVTVNIPVGTPAGDYVLEITTPGWAPGTHDPSGNINAKVTIPQDDSSPEVELTAPLGGSSYTYVAGGPPVSIPLAFTATASADAPILSVAADVNGEAVALTPTGLNTAAASATGTIQLSRAGIFTVNASATNKGGYSNDNVEITVIVDAPPPVVTITTPLLGASYYYDGVPLSIPFSFNATTLYGGFTSLSAALGSTDVAVTPSGLATLNANATGTLTITGSGTYVLTATAITAYGTTSASRSITVNGSTPAPTLAISAPVSGTVITRVAGSAPTNVPFDFIATAASGATISGLTGSLGSSSLSVTSTGLGTGTARGQGNLQVSAPGTYTFVAGATSGGTSASKSVSFTVQETVPPPPTCSVEWLPPISKGKVQKAGSTLPIEFRLECQACDHHGKGHHHHGDHGSCDHEINTSVVIAVYKVGSNSAAELFTYSRHSHSSGHYTIDSHGTYHCNYKIPKGPGTYQIDIYSSASNPQLLGTKQFTAR